jgi:hypothetical protein
MRRTGGNSHTVLALAALLAGTAACADAGPLEVRTVGAHDGFVTSMAASVAGARPLKQKSAGLLMPVGPCTAGIAFAAEGTGTGSHVGRFDIDLSFCMDPATGAISDAAATVAAANADRIVMTGNGQAVSPTELTFNLDIVGGTGRFDGATGTLAVVGLVGAAGNWTSSGTGWISY